MLTLFIILLGTIMGTMIGIIFEKSRVIDPEQLVGQFQFKRFTMLKVFLSAIATSLIVYCAFNLFGYGRLNWKTFALTPDIIGGALLGLGIALAGTCPSTLFGQLGAGYKDAKFALLGAITGAFAFHWLKPLLQEWIKKSWPYEKITIDQFGLGYNLTTLLFFSCLVLILYALEKYRPWREDMKEF